MLFSLSPLPCRHISQLLYFFSKTQVSSKSTQKTFSAEFQQSLFILLHHSIGSQFKVQYFPQLLKWRHFYYQCLLLGSVVSLWRVPAFRTPHSIVFPLLWCSCVSGLDSELGLNSSSFISPVWSSANYLNLRFIFCRGMRVARDSVGKRPGIQFTTSIQYVSSVPSNGVSHTKVSLHSLVTCFLPYGVCMGLCLKCCGCGCANVHPACRNMFRAGRWLMHWATHSLMIKSYLWPEAFLFCCGGDLLYNLFL